MVDALRRRASMPRWSGARRPAISRDRAQVPLTVASPAAGRHCRRLRISPSPWASSAATPRCAPNSTRAACARQGDIDAILAAYHVPRTDLEEAAMKSAPSCCCCWPAAGGLLPRAAPESRPRRRRRPTRVRLSEIAAGRTKGGGKVAAAVAERYERTPTPSRRARRCSSKYNCSGCHGQGGGGMGPALMDDKWRYGSDPANIYATIVQGRPNGMPAFGGHLRTSRSGSWWPTCAR
jgi:hypothetical protein